MGMNRHDAYYEPEDSYEDSAEFEWEVEQLMKGEYNPDNYSNFAEAVSEANDADRKAVEDILYQPQIDYEALGRKLYAMAYDYMEKYAVSKVQDGY
jgi:hypothetical protein